MRKHKNQKPVIRAIAMITVGLILASMMVMFAGCAAQPDTGEGESKTYAILVLPNGEKIEGEYESWYYYNNGMVRVTINNVMYTVHGTNIALISE